MTRYHLTQDQLEQTFETLRSCGGRRRECQVLWVSTWRDPSVISTVVHSRHGSHWGGFDLDSDWITQLWKELAATASGIRVQVHTHPDEAFHSKTDDSWPIIHTPGFLSLVIPSFATGPVSLDDAYLAEYQGDGTWCSVKPVTRLEVR